MSEWYPCENPERPNDPSIVWHWDACRGCHVAATATIRRCLDVRVPREVIALLEKIRVRTNPEPRVSQIAEQEPGNG